MINLLLMGIICSDIGLVAGVWIGVYFTERRYKTFSINNTPPEMSSGYPMPKCKESKIKIG